MVEFLHCFLVVVSLVDPGLMEQKLPRRDVLANCDQVRLSTIGMYQPDPPSHPGIMMACCVVMLTCAYLQLTVTIKDDLKLTQTDVANSNILSLTAT